MVRLLEALEDLDDVQNVYSNADIPEDVLARSVGRGGAEPGMAEWTRILGIDPGSRVTGFGLVDSNGASTRYVASGCIRARGR